MNNTVQKLKEFMTISQKSQNQVAKEIGLSGATISQFLDGTYKGDNKKISSELEKYLILAFQRLSNADKTVFNKDLQNTQRAIFACKHAHMRNDIVLLSGEAGAGKTTALKYYAEQNPGTIYIEATPCTTTIKSILRMIGKAIGKSVASSSDEYLEEICKTLKESNRLIIIDEADHLTFKTLQTLRTINDRTNVGILLSGNDKIYMQMNTGQKGYEFQQLKTRIIVKLKVANQYSIEELSVIFPMVDEKAIYIMQVIAETESLRSARKLYNIACDLVDNERITSALMVSVQKEVLGYVLKK